MKRLILPICLLFVAATAVGWVQAGTSAGARPAKTDNWSTLKADRLSKIEYIQLAEKLKQSGFLPLSPEEQRVLDEEIINTAGLNNNENESLSSTAIPPFPKILGSSRLNQTRYLHVYLPDLKEAKLRQGDVLASGWEIKKVDGRHVIAVFDGEEVSLPIIPYLEGAFEPEPDAEADADREEPDAEIKSNINGVVKSPSGEF